MAVPERFFASPLLLDMVVSEAQASGGGGSGGFTASLQQLANVATLPGIVGKLILKPLFWLGVVTWGTGILPPWFDRLQH
jgi:RNA-splicing ligase RtcB